MKSWLQMCLVWDEINEILNEREKKQMNGDLKVMSRKERIDEKCKITVRMSLSKKLLHHE